jgi:hypothetical protein
MKTLSLFEKAYEQLVLEIGQLGQRNRDLSDLAHKDREKLAEALQVAVSEHRVLRDQIVTMSRSKKRSDRKHEATLSKVRERNAYYRSKLAEYRRELVSVKSALRDQKYE